MQETDKFFDSVSARLDGLKSELSAASRQMQTMIARLDTVSAQIKKDIPVRDDTLEQDFNDMAQKFFDFSNDMDEFWSETRETLRNLNKKTVAENYSLEVKTFNIKARLTARAIDEVATAFGRLYPAAKASPLRLSIWLLENASLNLDKLASKILFMARELAKIIEKNAA